MTNIAAQIIAASRCRIGMGMLISKPMAEAREPDFVVNQCCLLSFGVLVAGKNLLSSRAEQGHFAGFIRATGHFYSGPATARPMALGCSASQRPRPRGEGVITLRMWTGIFSVGFVMAAGTLLVLDASLPGGLIEGSGTIRYAQTMAFTTLMMFQLFNAFNAQSDERSAFHGLFRNHWLWAAVALSLVLHILVVHVHFLQEAFSTTGLSAGDWLLCAVVASSVLWLRQASKLMTRAVSGGAGGNPASKPK